MEQVHVAGRQLAGFDSNCGPGLVGLEGGGAENGQRLARQSDAVELADNAGSQEWHTSEPACFQDRGPALQLPPKALDPFVHLALAGKKPLERLFGFGTAAPVGFSGGAAMWPAYEVLGISAELEPH